MSFLWSWLWKQLADWGLAQKTGKLVLLGLDNAGKTTLMHMLRDNILLQHMPTQKPTMETFTMGRLTFNLFDLGGHTVAQRLWVDYCADAAGIVYLIDAADPARFDESRAALDALLTDGNLAGVPVLILGNKIDAPGACNEDQLRQALGLYQTTGKHATRAMSGGDHARPIEIFMCSITARQGFKEGFTWLAGFMD